MVHEHDLHHGVPYFRTYILDVALLALVHLIVNHNEISKRISQISTNVDGRPTRAAAKSAIFSAWIYHQRRFS